MGEHNKDRGHHRDHQSHGQDGPPDPYWSRAHKDWRLWVAVVLMLGAMVAYVMTMDEAVPPGGKVQPAVPASP